MSKKSNKRAKIWILVVLTVIFLASSCYVFSSTEFNIKNIQIIGNINVNDQEIKMLLPFADENIFLLPIKSSEKRLKQDPRIQTARITRSLPNTVTVYIKEKVPVVLLNFQEIYGLTTECEPIPIKYPHLIPNLPIITGIEPGLDLIPFEKLESKKLDCGMSFFNSLSSDRFWLMDRISEINVSDPENLRVFLLSDGLEVNLGSGSYGDKMEKLLMVLKNVQNEREALRQIDLSYKNCAVLKYKKRVADL
ncbi:FtsQ-type POTRA domain-containing protein [bacterium]|nr:FtsQ-type POTRA domain-containing protein [bacterium]